MGMVPSRAAIIEGHGKVYRQSASGWTGVILTGLFRDLQDFIDFVLNKPVVMFCRREAPSLAIAVLCLTTSLQYRFDMLFMISKWCAGDAPPGTVAPVRCGHSGVQKSPNNFNVWISSKRTII